MEAGINLVLIQGTQHNSVLFNRPVNHVNLREGSAAVEVGSRHGIPDKPDHVRTFGDHARFVLDLNIVPAAKALSHLPVIADPSHGTGRADCVMPLARAAVFGAAEVGPAVVASTLTTVAVFLPIVFVEGIAG